MPSKNGVSAGYPVGLDAYTAAFMVPDFMFAVLVSGALSVTFIPVLMSAGSRANKQSAWQISSSMDQFYGANNHGGVGVDYYLCRIR